MQGQDEALEARGSSRAAEYEFGDEEFSDVVQHRRRGEVLEAGFVEAERDANAARVARDADAVLVCRGARVLQTADESADAVLAIETSHAAADLVRDGPSIGGLRPDRDGGEIA